MTAATAPAIRPLELRDLPEVQAIDKLVYPQTWSRAMYLDELRRPDERIYRVAADAEGRFLGCILGYGGFMIVADEAQITSVAVHPQHQGQRIGARLMLELHRAARLSGRVNSMGLEVRASNAAAQRLYRWFGYAPVATRRGYYRGAKKTGFTSRREDALVMWCHDIGEADHGERLDEIAHALEDLALGVMTGAAL